MEPWFENMISNETIVSFSKNIILYAKWTPNTYVITFETNGGSHIDDIKQPHGTAIKEPRSSIKEGYNFIGWYEEVELSNKYVFDLMPTKNMTLYAKWKEIIIIKQSNQIRTKSSYKNTILIGSIVGCIILVIVFVTKMRKKRQIYFSSGENKKSDDDFSVPL